MRPRRFLLLPVIRVANSTVYGRRWSVRWGRRLFMPAAIMGVRP